MRRALHRVLAIGLSVGALGVAGCGGDRSNHTAGPPQRATDVNGYGCMSDELDKWRRCPANPAYNKSPAQREAEESRARVAHQSVPLARDVIAHIKSKTRDAALNNGAYFFQCVDFDNSDPSGVPDPYTGAPPKGTGVACVASSSGESVMVYIVSTGYDRYRVLAINVHTNALITDRSGITGEQAMQRSRISQGSSHTLDQGGAASGASGTGAGFYAAYSCDQGDDNCVDEARHNGECAPGDSVCVQIQRGENATLPVDRCSAREAELLVTGELKAAAGGASDVGDVVCQDFTGDGLADLTFTATYGASGFSSVAVIQVGGPSRSSRKRWRLALDRYGEPITPFMGDLVVGKKIARPGDPTCCATGGWDNERLHWDGNRLRVVERIHTSVPFLCSSKSGADTAEKARNTGMSNQAVAEKTTGC